MAPQRNNAEPERSGNAAHRVTFRFAADWNLPSDDGRQTPLYVRLVIPGQPSKTKVFGREVDRSYSVDYKAVSVRAGEPTADSNGRPWILASLTVNAPTTGTDGEILGSVLIQVRGTAQDGTYEVGIEGRGPKAKPVPFKRRLDPAELEGLGLGKAQSASVAPADAIGYDVI